MILKVQPDKQKAKALRLMAETTLKRVRETDIEKYSSNVLTDYYTIIRDLMEALTCVEGTKIKGEGSHVKIIDYVCEKHFFDESIRQFLQELRDYRNRTYYEGFMIKYSYMKTNQRKIESIIKKLKERLDGVLE
ncbi:MAG: hypothetical protein ABIC91_04055 [Nanoarchaeota archaeon]|nr:hypothetical protein [Nanoarchaeota archaeon]MBU1030854.1 hypothetical protein [Nanoarchaeota archaeon]